MRKMVDWIWIESNPHPIRRRMDWICIESNLHPIRRCIDWIWIEFYQSVDWIWIDVQSVKSDIRSANTPSDMCLSHLASCDRHPVVQKGKLSHKACRTKFVRQVHVTPSNRIETLSQVQKIIHTTQWCGLVLNPDGLWSDFTFTVRRRRLPFLFSITGNDSRVQSCIWFDKRREKKLLLVCKQG